MYFHKAKMNNLRILIFLLLTPLFSHCQNTIGLPNIVNYNKILYKGGLQNWKIKQDKNGILYVANNEGLLTFDGKHWKIYSLPNKTIVRSMGIANDGKIYVGGQDEIGFFEPNPNGRLIFHTLIDKLDIKDRAFSDIWDIETFNNDVFFRTTNRIFRLQNETITVYKTKNEWTFLGKTNNNLFIHDKKNGVFLFKNNVWENMTGINMGDKEVTSILHLQNGNSIITTLKNGAFNLTKDNVITASTFNSIILNTEKIFTAIEINNNLFAIGTTNGGVYIIDTSGRLIQHFSKTEGLQSDDAHCIFLDQQQNLWLGLDNGIDCIAFNSAVKLINPDFNGSSGYAAAIFKNNLYLGTSQGLYAAPLQTIEDLSFSKGSFSHVKNTSGQAWSLAEVNQQLLLASHDGAFTIKDNIGSIISNKTGFWNFTALDAIFPSAKIISGNYTGLSLLDYSGGNFSVGAEIPNFTETSRYLVLDKNNNIWVSHPYHGIYKVNADLNGNYTTKLYTANNGLPSTLNNHVYKIKGEIAVGTEKGIFVYNYTKDIFEPSETYKKLLGSQSIRYLKEDTEGNIWFVHEKNVAVLSFSNISNPTIIYLPELNKKLLSGFEFIYPYNKNNIFIGGDEGLFHVNFEKYRNNIVKLKAQITSVNIFNKNDSLLFGGYFTNPNDKQLQSEKQVFKIKNSWKTIRFEFTTPYYGQENSIEYSYRLKGFENNWSEWSTVSEKEYTNLPAKDYSFEIKVRNNNDIESDITSYKFIILPPWYKSIWAYLFYFLSFCAGIAYLYKWQENKFEKQKLKNEKEQKRQQYLHQLEIEKTENELVILRNEKLNTEIDFKNAELATTAMHLVQKGELLSKIKSDLSHIAKTLDNEKAVASIKKMMKVLGEDERIDNDWEHFAQHFDKVNSDFIRILKENHPDITPNEIKLSTYLHMNLSTKEIAQLMNISVRGIEISRYRLRKKINLATEISLYDYLVNISKKGGKTPSQDI